MNNDQDRTLKILILGEPTSVHSIRWVSQLKDTGWDIRLFCPVAPRWTSWLSPRYKHLIERYSREIDPIVIVSVKVNTIHRLSAFVGSGLLAVLKLMKIKRAMLDSFYGNITKKIWQNQLVEILNDFRPDIVHSLGINQEWRNLCLPVLDQKMKGNLPMPWIYSSWGTDLTYYPELSHQNKSAVKAIVRSVDYFISECKRDYDMAVQYGFRGQFLGYLPAFGGLKVDEMKSHRAEGPVGNRKNIYIKGRGTEDPVGRAMLILDVIERFPDTFSEHPIYIGQATPSIIKRAKAIQKKYGLDIHILPYVENPADVLYHIGSSRISISLTINDGLPATLVEAMALGAFPMFSNLPSIGEWITHGSNGYLIDINDPEMLIACFKQALTDDALVTRADKINAHIVRDALEYGKIREKVISIYQHVAQQNRTTE
jgi:glycosyltransferase involved in cell wall biosynthesis